MLSHPYKGCLFSASGQHRHIQPKDVAGSGYDALAAAERFQRQVFFRPDYQWCPSSPSYALAAFVPTTPHPFLTSRNPPPLLTFSDQPECVAAHLGLACIHFRAGDYRESLKIYLHVLKIHPNCAPTVRLGIGLCYYMLKMYDLSKAAFQRVLQVRVRCAVCVLFVTSVACRGIFCFPPAAASTIFRTLPRSLFSRILGSWSRKTSMQWWPFQS